ncbi:MAG: DUF86 domain-containing protein [Candidatus Bathyarchaeota archaeon]|nr:DUF86 domain-containing protein [Candidatus Bathyarchaeota archaeon A05DMB-3]MDH7607104.1 DUF86 domain-containing protein [Candidatus Bathyarchaeota archaeon]
MPINVEHIKQRIIEILETTDELKRLTSKPSAELGFNEKYAIRYHIIVLAEALGSLCFQIATEDFNRTPQSYSQCFKILEEEGVCNCARDLTAIMRLRNLLVHRYWIIDDNQVYNAIKSDFEAVDKFLKSVRDRYAIRL